MKPRIFELRYMFIFTSLYHLSGPSLSCLSLLDFSVQTLFLSHVFVKACLVSWLFVLTCSYLPSCGLWEQQPCLFSSFVFHVDPRRTASTYWEPIINQAHLTFNIIRSSLFVKEVLSFSFSKWGLWNLEKLHTFFVDTQQVSKIFKPTFFPYALLHTHSINFCWSATNIPVGWLSWNMFPSGKW